MKYLLFLFLIIPLKLTHAFDREHLRDFRGQHQSGQRIRAMGFNLQHANFSGLDLTGADFSEADLRGANFTGATLTDAIFVGTILTKVNFQRANLTRANLKGATLNGAKFKKACFLGIKYHLLRSAKGTVLEDEKEMKKKRAYEEKIERIEQEFCAKKQPSIPVEISSSAKETYTYLNEVANKGKEYALLDMTAYDSSSQTMSPLVFLKAPLFKSIVKSTLPIAKSQGLIIFLENDDLTLPRWNPYHPTLDLHGKIPLPVKYKWMKEFIIGAFHQHLEEVEIITGRGLHNPQGKMGTLWTLCHDYLIRKKLSPYIQGLQSISKQGGWRVTLKNERRKLSNKGAPGRTLSFEGSTPAFQERKLIFISQKSPVKKVKPPVEKPKKIKKNQGNKGKKKST